MNERKYNKRLHRSKYEFPTHVVMSGLSRGTLNIGHVAAKTSIETACGHSVSHWKARHTRSQWVWLKPIGVKVAG